MCMNTPHIIELGMDVRVIGIKGLELGEVSVE